MKKEDEIEILKEISILKKKLKELIPYGEIKEVKAFGKSKHVILSKEFSGKKALIIKIAEE